MVKVKYAEVFRMLKKVTLGFCDNKSKYARKEVFMKKTAIVLSGGLGTRLQPFTNIMPKPLLPVGEKAILEIQIENLKNVDLKK